MRQRITVPRKPYILFELVKINKVKYRRGDADALTQEDVIHMVVMPENINYALQSRDYLVQASEDFFLTKYSMQPEKVSISGTFGAERRLAGGTYMSGWERLVQFEETIVKKSKLLTTAEMYALNYYDFLYQKFGSININSWTISASARANTNFERYSLDFVLLGDLLKTTDSSRSDKLLNLLTAFYLPGTGWFAGKSQELQDWYNTQIYPTAATLQSWYEGYSLVLEEANSIMSTIAEGVNAVKGLGGRNTMKTVNDFGKLDQFTNIYSSGTSIFR